MRKTVWKSQNLSINRFFPRETPPGASSALSFLAQFQTFLLCPDLRNLRHPSREQCNLQVEANTSHDFGPDISTQIPSFTAIEYDFL